MKRFLFTISFFAFEFYSMGQITVTQADGPYLGMEVIVMEDTSSTLSPGPSGTAQVWDFSSLTEHNTGLLTFHPIAGTPAEAEFSSSDFAISLDNDMSQLGYATNNSTGYANDGVYQTVTGILYYNDPAMAIIYPSTYLTGYLDTTEYEFSMAFSFPIDSVKNKSVIYQTSIVDGWGTVITPEGTYSSLRQRDSVYQVDSTWMLSGGTWTLYYAGEENSIAYNWWANGIGHPVMAIRHGSVDSIYNFYKVSPVSTGEMNRKENSVNVFPNPAVDELSIHTEKDGFTYTIRNVNGKIMESRYIQGNSVSVDVSDYLSGNYFYSLIHNDGNIRNGKFIVIRYE